MQDGKYICTTALFIKINLILFYFSLVEDLEFFETRKKPVAPFVAQRLTHLEASLQSGIIEPPISEEIKSKFEDN